MMNNIKKKYFLKSNYNERIGKILLIFRVKILKIIESFKVQEINLKFKKLVTNLIILFYLMLLASCSGDKCIDADDFGFKKITISSRYKDNELNKQQADYHVAPWINSNYRVNGRPLLIMVKTWEGEGRKNKPSHLSAWCPWYGTSSNNKTMNKFCERLAVCKFTNDQMCTNTSNAKIQNAPCIFKNGVGLYALISDKGVDPNATVQSQRDPEGITLHMGEPVVGYNIYDIGLDRKLIKAGGILYKYENDQSLSVKHADSYLYFKILDKFYDDNGGQYRVVIKSGVVDDNDIDPIEYLTKIVKDNLYGSDGEDGIIKKLYLGLVRNTGFTMCVSAILTLYVAFSALSFLTGNLNMTQGELITRVVKIVIISMLLKTESSWNFFNDYLFVFFIDGAEQILKIIREAGQSGSGSASLLGLMLAPQTFAKLISLIFVDARGFIYCILYLAVLFFIVKMLFQAAILYLTALIIIGMIIIMGPIFMCFALFKITRSLFENWLKQLISYAIQPMILFCGITFISLIIRTEIYNTLGFKVCKLDFPNLAGGAVGILGSAVLNSLNMEDILEQSMFYWWFPNPIRSFTKQKAIIPVPFDHFKDDDTYCEAYGCLEERYVELPYLHPIKDINRINGYFAGKFVHLDGLWLIILCVYLLSKFNGLSISVARFLSSNSGSLTDIQQSANSAMSTINNRTPSPISDGIEKVKMVAAKKYENMMMSKLGNDALSKGGGNKSVLATLKNEHGIDEKDINKNAIKEYKDKLGKALKEQNPEMTDNEVKKQASILSNKNYNELPDGFKNAEMAKLAGEAQAARKFRSAYVQVHQAMSGRGIGLIGKNVDIVGKFQDKKANAKEIKAQKAEDYKAKVKGKIENVKGLFKGKTPPK